MLLFSHLVISDSLWPHGLQHTRLPCASPSPRACSNSCPLSQQCDPTISSSVVPFSRLQSFPAPGSFPMSQFFTSGVPKYWKFTISPSNEYLISLVSKGLSRVFSSTTVRKHHLSGGRPDYYSDRYLGCFPMLVIQNNTSVNVEVQISFWISVFISLDKYPYDGLLDHTVDLLLFFFTFIRFIF